MHCGWSVETVEKLRNGCYVDNCVVSVESSQERDKFVKEATSMLASGGFDLRGRKSSGDSEGSECSLVLGVLWNKDTRVVTKRNILAATHKLYDPFGVTCPVSLLPKLVLRKL